MRTPSRKRPPPRAVAVISDKAVLKKCADDASYVGSPEHKSYPSFAGPPRLRSDATRCPKHLKDPLLIASWLRRAILEGNVSEDPAVAVFPRYVWGRYDGGTWFEARLVNADQGTYKAYPLNEDEVPKKLRGGR